MLSPSRGGDSDTPPTRPSDSATPFQPVPAASILSSTSTQHVVSNTTPLITLGEIGLLNVLRQLYGTLWIPSTVLAEYQHGRSAHPQRPDLQGLLWVMVQPAPADPLVPAILDTGERDAIALARALQASRILLDERSSRAVAARLNLTVTGSAGVLLAAKQVGLIPLVRPYLDRMVAQGRYISPSVYDQVVRQAGE